MEFYRDVMGMTLIDKLEFPDMTFDLYFLTTLPEGETYPYTPGSDEAHKYLWTMKGATLELTHNYGTEKDDAFKYHPGNAEKDGFGHVAFNCNDVYASSARLEEKGIQFKKKPDDGRMKGLAFVYDPDGYWVEIVKRDEKAGISNEFNLSQTMLRVKDPKVGGDSPPPTALCLSSPRHQHTRRTARHAMRNSRISKQQAGSEIQWGRRVGNKTLVCEVECRFSADGVSTAKQKSIPFYNRLGMTLCREVHMSDFSLYFMSCLPEGVTVTHSRPCSSSSPHAFHSV